MLNFKRLIYPQNLLDGKKLWYNRIKKIADDEQFVLLDSIVREGQNLYISNYGRLVVYEDGIYCLILPKKENGRNIYELDGKKVFADELVAEYFIDHKFSKHSGRVIHGSGLLNDYFKTLKYADDTDEVYLLYKNMRTVANSVWHNMFTRTEGIWYDSYRVTYVNVRICDEWHEFEAFYDWFRQNYYEYQFEKMTIDKDLLSPVGEPMYSPETTCFLPTRINGLLKAYHPNRNHNPFIPMGIEQIRKGDPPRLYYRAKLTYRGRDIWKFESKSQMEVATKYAEQKVQLLKEIAQEGQNIFPAKVYNGLRNYSIKLWNNNDKIFCSN